jgi:hypothetical protein
MQWRNFGTRGQSLLMPNLGRKAAVPLTTQLLTLRQLHRDEDEIRIVGGIAMLSSMSPRRER